MVKKMRLRIFHADGKREYMQVENEYHAQNVLSLLFIIGDKNAKNDIVFAEILGTKIFAYRDTRKNRIVIRNPTESFVRECKEMKGEVT
jgi:hypothetical protein